MQLPPADHASSADSEEAQGFDDDEAAHVDSLLI